MGDPIDEIQEELGLRREQATKAFEILGPALQNKALMDDLLKRRKEIVGRWELFQIKPFMGSGTQSTFERYEFRDDMTYGYFSQMVRSYVAGPFAPDAGSSYYSGPSSSAVPDDKWDETGRFIPGQRDEQGGFTLLLFPSDRDNSQEMRLQMFATGLQIGNRVFKRG